MPLSIRLNTNSTSPIWKQIVEQVRLGVSSGRVEAGEQLPSVRALAERLLVNPNTVARAYTELASDGVIDTQPGRGVFVSPPRQVFTKAERHRRIEPLINALVAEGLSLGLSETELADAVLRRAQNNKGGKR